MVEEKVEKTLPKIDMSMGATPVAEGSALPKLDLGGMGEALDARAKIDNAEMNPYTAFDGLNTLKLQAENGIDPSASKVKGSIQNGTIKDDLKASTQREQAETLASVDLSKVPKPQAALKFLLGDSSYRNIFTDPQAEKKPLGIIAAMSAGEGELKNAIKNFGKPQRDTAINDAILEVLAASDDPKIIEKLSDPNIVASYNDKTGKIQLWSEGATPPMYAPEDFVADVATGGATLALRAAAKGGLMVGTKLLAAEADIPFAKFMKNYFGREVGYSVGTGAFMSAADAADSGALGSVMAGVLGPTGTMALFQASRAGFSRFLINIKRDKTRYRALQDAFNAHPENKMSKVGLEVMAQVDRGVFDEKTMTLEGKTLIAQSPVATIAKAAIKAQDVGAVQSVKESAFAAVGQDKDLAAMAKLAQGTGEASHLTMLNPEVPVESFDPYPVESLGTWADDNLSIMEGHTDLATKLVNAHNIQSAMGQDVYNDFLNAASTEARGIISNWTSLDQGRYRKGGLVDSMVAGFQTGKPKGLGTKFFRNPINYFKGMSGALAEMTTSNERFSRALNKKYSSYFEDHVYKGLSDEELVDYDNALYAMTDRNENMMIVPGGMAFRDTPDDVMHLTDKTITAIANARLGYERMYEDANRTAVQTFKNRGFVLLDGNLLGKPIKKSIPNHVDADSKALRLGAKDIDGVVWSKKMESEGWVAIDISDQIGNHKGVRIVDPSAIPQQGDVVEEVQRSNFKFLKPEEVGVRTAEIPETSRVLPYRTGYMPIMHSDDYVYSVLKVTREGGDVNVERVGGGQWKDEVEPAVIALNRAEGKPSNVVYTAFRRDVNNKAVEELYTDDYVLALREMDDAGLKRFRDALAKSGMDMATINMVMHTASKERIPKPRTFKHRGAERLRSATSITEQMDVVTKRIDEAEASGNFTPEEIAKMRSAAGQEAILEATPLKLLPSKAMTARYASSLSRFVAHADWNAKLVEEFKLRYRNALMDQSDWKSQIATIKDPAHPILGDTAEANWSVDFAREAQTIQDYLKMIHNVPTAKQLEARISIQNAVDKIIQTGTTRGGEATANAILKYAGDGAIPAVSKAVRSIMYHGTLGMGNMVQFVVQQFTWLNAAKYLYKDPESLLNSVKDSHDVIAAFTADNIKGFPKNEYGSYLKDLLKRSGYNTGVNYDAVQEALIDTTTRKGQAAHIGRNVLAAGSVPARMGENMGRLVIWMSERNALIKQVKAGAHAGLKIDSDEFLTMVNMKADEAAGNFLKYNQAAYQKADDWVTSIASMSTQFMSYPIHQIKYMSPFNPKMDAVEKMGVWTAWAGVFGLAGIPMLWDAVLAGESLKEEAGMGFKGDFRKSIDGYAEAFADKVTSSPLSSKKLKQYLTRQVTAGGITALTEGQINISSRAGLAEQLTKYADGLQYNELAGPGANFIFTTLKNAVSATKQPSVFDMLKTSTETIPGIYNPLTAMTDEYTDKRGRLVKQNISLGEKLLLATGIKIGDEVLRTEHERQNYMRSQSVDLVIRNAAKAYAELVNKDQATGDKYLENFMKRMEDEPLLQKKFIKMAINEMVTYGLTAEDREIIQEALLIRRGIKE